MDKVEKYADELNASSKSFSLSHAVLATAEMIGKSNNSCSGATDEDLVKMVMQNGQNAVSAIQSRVRQIDGIEDRRVYISVHRLSNERRSTAEGARTYYYVREVPSNTPNTKPYRSEHFEIYLPPEDNIEIVKYDQNGRILKKCVRFLIGHELGHLWLHLDQIKAHINEMQGTKLILDPDLETEANKFSFRLSYLRDLDILQRAEKTPKKPAP